MKKTKQFNHNPSTGRSNVGLFKSLAMLVVNVFRGTVAFLEASLNAIGNIILVVLPFFSIYIGNMMYESRGYFGIGGEYILVAVLLIVAFTFKGIARIKGTTSDFPVPARRFTYVDQFGEVTVPIAREQEMILYMADLEDYIDLHNLKSI